MVSQIVGNLHSALLEQAALQAPPLQAYGSQSWVPPATQVPVPLHVDALVSVNVPEQAGARHCVPDAYLRQAPAPSHWPSLPQPAAPWLVHVLLGSLAPGATGEQVPIVAVSVHDTQAPLHIALQQTPCAEQTNPAAHSGLVAH